MSPFLYEYEVDQATADLIVQLQLEDVGIYFDRSKGKSREPTDEELAFKLQNEELENSSQFLLDKRMAISMAAAVVADGQVLADNKAREEMAAIDRQIAHNLSNNEPPPTAEQAQSKTEPGGLDDETLDKLRILYISGLEDDNGLKGDDADSIELEHAESSAWAAGRAHRPQSMRRCEACRDEIHFINVVRVPCRHEYCRPCLEELFEASMTDESLFPPRCCRQPIAASDTILIFLKSDIIKRYEKKKIEFETPNRTYCYSPECSTFIPPAHIEDDVATCPECGHTTCAGCKTRAHTGDCPSDTAMQQLLATAQENGWQRCSSCWRVVEIDHGCNHMTCRCGHQFCYNCGQQWKTCTCEQWDEHRLLERAYQIIDREPDYHINVAPQGVEAQPGGDVPLTGGMTAGDAQRALLVARTVRELQENHECDHNRWRYVRGSHRCEECSFRLPEYIFECRQCRLRACNRCKRNRL
ncbi:hypothetical protein BDV12DRAFT_210633 [Aspergillus spectabilis]